MLGYYRYAKSGRRGYDPLDEVGDWIGDQILKAMIGLAVFAVFAGIGWLVMFCAGQIS